MNGRAWRRNLRPIWWGTLAVATVVPAWAADDNRIIFPGGTGHATEPASAGGGTANLVTLVVALVLAAVGAWLFLRNRRTTGIAREGRSLTIEETRSLGNRQYLVVAAYEDKKFLLGVCPGRIDLLAPLTDGRAKEDSSR